MQYLEMIYTLHFDIMPTITQNRSSGDIIGSSLLRTVFVVVCVMLVLRLSSVPGTNAFFADKAGNKGNSFLSGYWVPTLAMTVSPENPDGPNGTYTKTPCVTLSYSGLSSGTATIWYEFSNDGDPKAGGSEYKGTCIPVPDGNPTHFQAVAINDANDAWRSAVMNRDFTVAAAVVSGDVVINEVMWMGSAGDADDEWIELRNTTDHSIDLSNWQIGNGGSGNGHIEIPNGYSIKQNGYFLILKKKWDETKVNLTKDLAKDEGLSHVAGMNLLKKGEQLTLVDKGKHTIDKTPSTCGWPAGWHGIWLHMSMERNDSPKDGTKQDNWHTCVDKGCKDTKYWKGNVSLGPNFGTPGGKNLSVNDPSSPDYDPAFMEAEYLDLQETSEADPITEPGTGVTDPNAAAVNDSGVDPGIVTDPTMVPVTPKTPSADQTSPSSGGSGTPLSGTDIVKTEPGTDKPTGSGDIADTVKDTGPVVTKKEADTGTDDGSKKDAGSPADAGGSQTGDAGSTGDGSNNAA